MANTLLTRQEITFECLRILKNNLKFAKNVYRGYDDQFGQAGAKAGATLNVRKPPRFLGRSGQAVNIEGLTDAFVPLTLNSQFGVDFQASSSELKLSLDDFSRRYLRPAAAAIANKIDADGLLMAKNNTANAVGTPGAVPNTLLLYLQATQKLDEMAAPQDGMRYNLISPAMRVNIVDALKGLFQATTQIAEQYNTGMMGQAIGLSWYQDQNIATHTVGPLGGASPVVNGAGQSGSSLITNGWTAAPALRLKQGDIYTVGTLANGIVAVNPQSRVSTGSLQQFVVTADSSSDGAGNMTIPCFPAMNFAGQFQNVALTGATMNGASINVLGAANTVTPTGIMFHESAYALACVPLDVPDGVDMGYVATDKDTGISVRFVRQYVATTDQWISRFDTLYGYAPLYPELACRIQS